MVAQLAPADVLARMLHMFETGTAEAVHEVVADDSLDHQGLGNPLRGPAGFLQVAHWGAQVDGR